MSDFSGLTLEVKSLNLRSVWNAVKRSLSDDMGRHAKAERTRETPPGKGFGEEGRTTLGGHNPSHRRRWHKSPRDHRRFTSL
jgi:hypothetical protein